MDSLADNDCDDDDFDGVNKGINEVYNHSYSHNVGEGCFGRGYTYRIEVIFMQNSQGLTIFSFLSYYRHFFFLYSPFFQQFRAI